MKSLRREKREERREKVSEIKRKKKEKIQKTKPKQKNLLRTTLTNGTTHCCNKRIEKNALKWLVRGTMQEIL